MKLGKKFEAGEIDEALYSTLATDLEKHIERMQNIDDNEPILHPRNAVGAMLAFSTYAEGGKSDNDIALLLNEHGYRTTGTHGERLFEGDSVQDLLQNRFYIGEVQYKGTYYPGRQPALIPKALFEKCQEVRVTRHGRAARRPSIKRVYPLSRIAVCARCGQPMRGQFGERYRYYRDPTRTIHQCTQRQIRADQTERMLIDYLSRIQLPEDWRQRVLEMSLGNQAKLQDVERRRANLEKQLTRAKNLYQLGDIEEAEYHALRNDLKTKLAAMEPVQEPDVEWAAELLGNLPKLLKSATLEELQEIFRSLLKTVYLDSGPRGPVVAIEPRPFVKQLLDVAVMKTSRRDIEVRWSKKKRPDDDDSGSVVTVNGGVFGNHENSDTMAFDAGEENVADETQQPVSSALANCRSKLIVGRKRLR